MTNAERQRRYRERRAAGRPPRPKPRPARWAAALAELRILQAEYEAWRDQLPESLADSRTAELLDGVLDVDLGRRRGGVATGGVRPGLNATAYDDQLKGGYRWTVKFCGG